jgi:hypothetical protein
LRDYLDSGCGLTPRDRLAANNDIPWLRESQSVKERHWLPA